MQALKKLVRIYDKIEGLVLVASFVATVSLVAVQVVMRYIFNNSLSWSEELTRFIFVWQVWMGTSIACKNNNHIRVEILSSVLKGKAKTVHAIIGDALVLAFTIFLVYDGFIVTGSMLRRGMLTPAMQIPMYLMFLSLPVSSICVTARLFPRLAGEIMSLFVPLPAEEA
ncbi:MAG: TRAP transporter small permease [Synergistaceae bacterium]|jgi:TRAP-type C4-dicarboxylate transport system permease small subunit|nr:TRAP transporter small permease [Synergistaceae bacterium]